MVHALVLDATGNLNHAFSQEAVRGFSFLFFSLLRPCGLRAYRNVSMIGARLL